jgi:hypothetical protein
MKLVLFVALLILSLPLVRVADSGVLTNSQAQLREQLFERFLAEDKLSNKQLNSSQNYDQDYTNSMRQLFDSMVVDPSFGYRWDEVPAPTITGSNAMAAVDEFVATNGWDMQKDGLIFSVFAPDKSKLIRGLPWTAIHDREFPAVTHNGILYVWFIGWHHNDRGIAYNPKTNKFVSGLAAFKPIGQHWYCWATTDDGATGPQQYEGTGGRNAAPSAAKRRANQ